MSVTGSPSAVPAGAPQLVPPPQAARSTPRRPGLWKLWVVLGVVAVIAVGVYAYRRQPRGVQKAAPLSIIRTAKLSVGTIERVLRLSGITSTRNYRSITVPIMRGAEGARDMTLIKLVPGGTRVKKGDVIAQIDAQALVDHLDDVKAGVEQAQAAIEQRRAELAVDWENLQQTLRQDKAALDKAKLDYGARETRTAIDQEILKLALDEAQESYKQDQANLAFKEISQKIDLHLLEIARDRQIKHRDRHVEDLKKFTFTAPMDGLAVIQTTFTRNGELSQIQLGDAVYSGQIFMKIVDTSKMQVETSANQTECNQLRIGMPARITLDAFPGLMLKGKIYSIGAMGVRGWRENYYIRNVPVRVVIDDQDPRLIPDLSAAVDIILAQRENALILPLEALHREGGKAVVYVKRGNRFERRTIQVGFQSFTHAEVLSGLTVGDEVALEPLAAEPAQTAK